MPDLDELITVELDRVVAGVEPGPGLAGRVAHVRRRRTVRRRVGAVVSVAAVLAVVGVSLALTLGSSDSTPSPAAGGPQIAVTFVNKAPWELLAPVRVPDQTAFTLTVTNRLATESGQRLPIVAVGIVKPQNLPPLVRGTPTGFDSTQSTYFDSSPVPSGVSETLQVPALPSGVYEIIALPLISPQTATLVVGAGITPCTRDQLRATTNAHRTPDLAIPFVLVHNISNRTCTIPDARAWYTNATGELIGKISPVRVYTETTTGHPVPPGDALLIKIFTDPEQGSHCATTTSQHVDIQIADLTPLSAPSHVSICDSSSAVNTQLHL